ncbi:MAG: Wzz/FepE/Etk N-terminal domain-containing protein [Bacteroidia bacterium]|nr:Wzz/FepE/Etk N-terminal domain-containing protein [Bacteroidia bacterium]MDW8346970.1 Wzz/FepE/Etk N-terminal domain-containing protein [Bacteroidia bacterium]
MTDKIEYKFDLKFLVNIFFRFRKHIIIATSVALFVSIVTSLFLKNYYRSKCVVLAYNANSLNPATLFLRNSFGSAIVGSSVITAGNAEDCSRIMAIMESKDVTDVIIKEFNLYQRYDIDTNDKKAYSKVNRYLRGYTNIVRTDKNMVEVTVEDQDPIIAAKIANRYAELANEKGSQIFKADITRHAEVYKKKYDEKYKEIKRMRDSINYIESSKKGDLGDKLYLQKMLESETSILGQIKNAYEVAQISAEQKINVLSIVEMARPDFKPVRPKRTLIVLSVTLSTLAASILMAAVIELFRAIKTI